MDIRRRVQHPPLPKPEPRSHVSVRCRPANTGASTAPAGRRRRSGYTSLPLTSVGQDFHDSHVNTYVASRQGSTAVHRWLGFIHAMYMVGCLLGPFAGNGVASSARDERGESRWYVFYTVPLALGVVNLVLVGSVFWDTMGSVKRNLGAVEGVTVHGLRDGEGDARLLIKNILTERGMWLLKAVLLLLPGYCGHC
jgi:hypothetical protein